MALTHSRTHSRTRTVARSSQLNPDVNAFQRKFVSDVRRAEELARKLRFFQAEVTKAKLVVPSASSDMIDGKVVPLEDLETQFEELDKELRDVNRSNDALTRDGDELVELKHVLEKAVTVFKDVSVLQFVQ